MNDSTPKWSSLKASDLEPIVAKVLDNTDIEILDWNIKAFTGGTAEYAGRGLGVIRISGHVHHQDDKLPWSVVLKATEPSETDPNAPNYWKREILAYQSGVLEQLPGPIVVPQCYAIQEFEDGECWLWLEDIQTSHENWTMEDHRRTARHLGQFNGKFLTGHPLPEEASWMIRGRTRGQMERFEFDKEQFLKASSGEISQQWLTEQTIERIIRLNGDCESLLTALDRLPLCYCHHDAFKRNLLIQKNETEKSGTVAIDWALTGYGGVGQEIGITTAMGLLFLEVPAVQARELDEAIFGGYIDGLRDVGWKGDQKLARFGYTATATLTAGLRIAALYTHLLQIDEHATAIENIIGKPLAEILEQWRVAEPFLLDLGDEALELMHTI